MKQSAACRYKLKLKAKGTHPEIRINLHDRRLSAATDYKMFECKDGKVVAKAGVYVDPSLSPMTETTFRSMWNLPMEKVNI